MTTAGDCQAKALDLLARRPHFRRELESKLAARGFAAAEVEAALDRLEALGYLDDRRAARDLAAGPLARKGYGPRRVAAELRRRGAPDEAIDEVLAATGDERERAREVARRWRPGRAVDPATLARHLERKGYSPAVIREILEEAGSGGEDL